MQTDHMRAEEVTAPNEGQIERAYHARHPNYLMVLIILGILTAGELLIATLLTTSPITIPLLILSSIAKGALVALFYMHLASDSRVYAFFFAFAIFILAVPFVVTMILLFATRP